jgi:hypothetical protein
VETPPVQRQPIHRSPAPKQHIRDADSAIAKAADDVRRIVESLEQALDKMEEVQELVELAESQKFDDEREIESLRRAMRRIQPPPREQERRHEHRREESRREEPRRYEEPRHAEPADEDSGSEEQGS